MLTINHSRDLFCAKNRSMGSGESKKGIKTITEGISVERKFILITISKEIRVNEQFINLLTYG